MPRKRSWYRIEARRLYEVLERLSLKDGLLLWVALGEDPGDFPLGKAAARRQAIHRIRRDKLSQRIKGNGVTECHAPSPDKRKGKKEKGPRYPDPAGALAQELGGWRAGLLYRARKEQNPLIQRLAHAHRESLLELLNLAEGLPLPRRIPTTLAWLPEFERELERLGDAEVQKALLEVRKRGAENPLSYAARVLASRGVQKKEEVWETIGQF